MTLKKYLSVALASSTKVEGMTKNQLIVITGAGTIIGRLASEDDTEAQKLLPNLANLLTEDYKKEFLDSSEDLPDNDGFLVLVDAQLLTSANNTVNFPSIIVFFDQIIGITVGSHDNT